MCKDVDRNTQPLPIIQRIDPRPSPEEVAAINAKRALEEALNAVSDELIVEIVRDEGIHIGQEIMKNVAIIQTCHEVCNSLQNEVVNEMIGNLAKEVLKEVRNEELQKRLAFEAKSQAIEDIAEEMLEDQMAAMSNEIAKQEMAQVSRTLALFDNAPEMVDEIADDVIEELVGPIAKEIFEGCQREREQKVLALRKRSISRLKSSTFKAWRRYVVKRKSQRSILANFPSMLKSSSSKKSLDSTIKSTSIKKTLELRKHVNQLHEAIELEDKLIEETVLHPMNDLPDILHQNGLTHWKLILCTPTVDDKESIGKGLVEMIKRKLTINASAINSDQDFDFTNVLTCFTAPSVSMCVRWIDSDMIYESLAYSEKKRREFLMGTSSILFLHIEEMESLEDAKHRLCELVYKIPSVPGVSLMILTTSSVASKADISEALCLSSLVEDKAVTNFDVHSISVDIFKISTVLAVHNAVEASAKMSQNFHSNAIEVKVIRDFVEDFLADRYFTTVYTDLAERRAKCWPHKNPNDLVSLYNAIIDHLVTVSSSKSLENISWPIPEMRKTVLDDEIPSYWNDFPYVEQIRNWLLALKLPLLSEYDVRNYVNQLRSRGSDFSLAISRVNYSLRNMQEFEENVPWTDIINDLIDYKLGQRATGNPFNTSGSEILVVYFKHELETFQLPRSWTRSIVRKPVYSEKTSHSSFPEKVLKSELHGEIVEELNTSLAFEKKLESILNGDECSYDDAVAVDAMDLDKSDDAKIVLGSIHLPVISMISPKLGAIAGCKSRQHRIDFALQPMTRKRSRISMIEDDEDLSPMKVPQFKKTIKSKLVTNLDQKIQEEAKNYKNFEEKLLKALNQ